MPKKTYNQNNKLMSRRCFLQSVAVTAPVIRGHGRINPPVPVPNMALVLDNGSPTSLRTLVTGHATAVQLMFTACTTTCPIQAAIFQRVQTLIANSHNSQAQLLSLSIDPEVDTPKELSAWRHRFHAGPIWLAAAPTIVDAPQLQDLFGKANGADHSTQVHILDRQGRLIWRTFELPTADEIMQILQKI